jgi:hypothetical protein
LRYFLAAKSGKKEFLCIIKGRLPHRALPSSTPKALQSITPLQHYKGVMPVMPVMIVML